MTGAHSLSRFSHRQRQSRATNRALLAALSLQPAPAKEPLSAGRVQPRPPPPGYVPSVGGERTSQRAVLPLALLGAGAVAGGAAGFFGLQSMSSVRSLPKNK